MSTTRSQKRRNNQQDSTGSVSEGFVSPVALQNSCPLNQDPSRPKSPRIENRFLESLRASLKEEFTSEIKDLLVESPRELLKLLTSETRKNMRENIEEELENDTRRFHTPMKSVRITPTQNDDPNMVTGVLTDSTNQPKRTKVRTQSQPTSKERPEELCSHWIKTTSLRCPC